MSEQSFKKMKIFNLAKELNLSSETIIDFLKKKGFDVKSHMSSVTEDMMPVIMGHFKKDKEVAERHQRKIQEFRSTRKKETPEKTETVEKVEKKAAGKEDIPVQKEAQQPTIEEPLIHAVKEIPQPIVTETIEISVKEIPEPEKEVVTTEISAEPPSPVVETKTEKPKERLQAKTNQQDGQKSNCRLHWKLLLRVRSAD